jgi:hypothetical protein
MNYQERFAEVQLQDLNESISLNRIFETLIDVLYACSMELQDPPQRKYRLQDQHMASKQLGDSHLLKYI